MGSGREWREWEYLLHSRSPLPASVVTVNHHWTGAVVHVARNGVLLTTNYVHAEKFTTTSHTVNSCPLTDSSDILHLYTFSR